MLHILDWFPDSEIGDRGFLKIAESNLPVDSFDARIKILYGLAGKKNVKHDVRRASIRHGEVDQRAQRYAGWAFG